MKKICFFILLTTNSFLFSQTENLLTNGDFETFFSKNDLTSYFADTSLAKNTFKFRKQEWYSCPLVESKQWGTLDPQKVFRVCRNKNIPHKGKGFAAIRVYDLIYIDHNLFSYNNLVGKFNKLLEKGKIYRISFFVKPFIGNFLSNKLEVYISDTLIQSLAYKEFKVFKHNKEYIVDDINSFIPDFTLQKILKDTNAYEKIEFIYKAKNTGRYIYFGNITGGIPQKMIYTVFGYDRSKHKFPPQTLLIDDISVILMDSLPKTRAKQKDITKIKKHKKKVDFLFSSNSYLLDNVQSSKLEDLIKNLNIDSIFIKAYANDIGSENENKILSEMRAKGIRSIIIKKDPSLKEKIKVLAKGEVLLNKTQDYEKQRIQNRKAEIEIFYKEKIITFKNIIFEENSINIRLENTYILNELTNYLLENTENKIELHGHICCSKFEGSRIRRNYFLSKERAKYVFNYLVSKGVNKKQIFIKAFEADKQLYLNNTPEHYLNRRVEIHLLN